MRVAAPGKLVLAGAYAVLEGAPAIVAAVDRYAYAFEGAGQSTAEARAALADPPAVDVSELQQDGVKLGLGSSAAALVASIAFRAAQRGQDLRTEPIRRAIFSRAREAHAEVQSGGSGVDVAASTFGGVLRYTISSEPERVELPRGVHFVAFFSGASARTSDLRARVDALRARDARGFVARMTALAEVATNAERALRDGAASAFVEALAGSGPALAALGEAADAPIVPAAFATLAKAARAEDAAFFPSGAGGGDVGVFVGTAAPSASFKKKASAAGMRALALAIDSSGVRETSSRKKS